MNTIADLNLNTADKRAEIAHRISSGFYLLLLHPGRYARLRQPLRLVQ